MQLVISDAHAGLKKAIVRNLLGKLSKGSQDMVAAALRCIAAQQEAAAVEAQWEQLIGMLTEKFPAAAPLMAEAREDLPPFRSFPAENCHMIWSTKPLERLNKEIKRRPLVVVIFPNDAGIIRLVAALLLEQQNKWQINGRPVFSELSMTKLDNDADSSKGHNREVLSAAA